jgi:hypothetical protein
MKTRILALLACLGLAAFTAGCYHTVEGSARPGMPFAKDKIESRYERPVDQIFAAAKEVLRFHGTLTAENTIAKTLQAKIDNNTVGVRVEEVEPNVSRVVVQARKKTGLANIDLASEIDKQIALQLR